MRFCMAQSRVKDRQSQRLQDEPESADATDDDRESGIANRGDELDEAGELFEAVLDRVQS